MVRYHFLDNLLPDNQRTRDRLAREADAASGAVFDLLASIGGDVAGGLVLTSTDTPPSPTDDPLVPFTDDDLAYRVATLREDPDRWLDRDIRGGRFSLAGTQAKFAMASVDGRWYQPSPTIPSTHIVKPSSTRLPEADAVEAATMSLARLVGIPTPDTTILRVLGQRAFMTERFDRDATTTPATRVHGEDLAQAAGMAGGKKYGMTAKQAIQLLHRHDPTDALGHQFVERLAFAVASGNCDAHAKNYTLLLHPGGVALAPAYDQVTTLFWPDFDSTLAMAVGGTTRSAEVTSAHWAKLARTSGLPEDQVVGTARTISAQVTQAAEQAAVGLDPPLRPRFLAAIATANRGMAA